MPTLSAKIGSGQGQSIEESRFTLPCENMWLVQNTFRHADTNAINSQRLSSTQCAGRILREWQCCDSIQLIWPRESMKGSQGAGQLNQQCLSSDNSCNTQVSWVDMRARSPWDTVRYALGTFVASVYRCLAGNSTRLKIKTHADVACRD